MPTRKYKRDLRCHLPIPEASGEFARLNWPTLIV
jgi:hypothetical protein